jgi:hypothetical protein
LGEPSGPPIPFDLEVGRLPRTLIPLEPASEVQPLPEGVVALPSRARLLAAGSPEQSAGIVAEATRDLVRLAAEPGEHPSPDQSAPRLPIAAVPDAGSAELVALRTVQPAAEDRSEAKPDLEENAEVRFFEALAEIRALKRAANQAGE